MSAARYWRLVGMRAWGGGAIELSGVHLYSQGARVDGPATLTSVYPPDSGAVGDLQDEYAGTMCRWLSCSAPRFSLEWDFGVGVVQQVGSIRLGAGALRSEFLESATLQNSSDGIAWATAGVLGGFSWPGPAALQGIPADGDEAYYDVQVLLHMQGSHNSTAVLDSGPSRRASINYNALISTDQSRFGGSSLYLDGINARVATYVDMAGAGDRHIGLWFRPIAGGKFGGKTFTRVFHLGQGNIAGALSLACFGSENPTRLIFEVWTGPSTSQVIVSDGTISNDTWHYISLRRTGTTWQMHINGGLQSSTITHSQDTTATDMVVGGNYAGGEQSRGFIDDFRVTSGSARSGDVPAAAFPDAGFGAEVAAAKIWVRAKGALVARDVEFGGAGVIYGTTELQGAGSSTTPVKARVRLLRDKDGLLAREMWSHPVTGAFSFSGLSVTQKFTPFAQDGEGAFRPAAESGRVPEVLP